MSLYRAIIKPIFFSFDPETIHHFVFNLLKISSKIPGVSLIIKTIYKISDKQLETEVF